MPPSDLPPAPYAYVVEYRALDRCMTPSCALRSRDVFGATEDLQPDGERGGNIQIGKHGGQFFELFFHRGTILYRGEKMSFVLPETAADSELDMYLCAEEETHDFNAEVVFEEERTAQPSMVLGTQPFKGHTELIDQPKRAVDYGHERRAFQHVRIPIPARNGRTVRVTIKNTGPEGLGLGNPLVMKKVTGRGPRQVMWSVYDAVPWPLWDQMILKGTGDAKADWLREWVAKNGTYFQGGMTPGLITTSYSRRLLRAGFFNDVGEPMISRTVAETPPAVTHNVIAKLAAEGVQTFAFLGNFSIIPTYSYLGWDGGYDSEMPDHHYAIAARWKEWVAEHPYDDTFAMWWLANTHTPWPPAPLTSAPPFPEGLAPDNLNPAVFPQLWTNAMVSTRLLSESLEAQRAASPTASRMVYLGSDHGRGFTMRHEHRAFRSPLTGLWPGGMSHGVGADSEEMRAPFVLAYEGPQSGRRPRGGVIKDDISVLAVLRAVESFYGISLDLPDTRVFDSPNLSPAPEVAAHWDDDFIAGVGMANAIRFLRGDWAYAQYAPRIDVTPIWDKAGPIQRVVMGTPFTTGRFPAEELYARSKDPYELTNVAGQNEATVLDMRRRATDWYATYYDDASHGRYRYTLTFPARVTVTITAPRSFDAWVDGKPATMRTPRSVEITGTRVELQEKEETVGVIEIRGDVSQGPLMLRCADNALPVDVTNPQRPRLNLALGRTNCPVPKTEHVTQTPGSVMFSFERAHATSSGGGGVAGSGGGAINQDELMAGMKKWGYVRDIEKKP